MTKPNLHYDVHAISEIERVTGQPCWKLCQELPPPVRFIVAILWGGMIHDKPDVTIADVSSMVLRGFTDAIYRMATGTRNSTASTRLT